MSKNLLDQRPFSFKQFSLNHHRSTMKVGMDAILLGIWTQLAKEDKVLDVGSGSGIISLLLASRGAKVIQAIDIDENSVNEAMNNFMKSPWASQLSVSHQSLQSYIVDQRDQFDLVISNPPFFLQGLLSESERQNNARHAKSLSYGELIENTCIILKNSGILSVVLPYSNANEFIALCQQNHLFLKRKLIIFPRRGTIPNRINMEFSFHRTMDIKVEMLSIREENNEYSIEYNNMTKDYYLY